MGCADCASTEVSGSMERFHGHSVCVPYDWRSLVMEVALSLVSVYGMDENARQVMSGHYVSGHLLFTKE